MKVELIEHTSLNCVDTAISKCWLKESEKPLERIDRVCNKHKHSSMLEFAQYIFNIEGISLSTSHQLVRHRAFTFAQQSSRYTLKKILKDVGYFDSTKDIEPYCVLTDSETINLSMIKQMNELLYCAKLGYSNDELKYLMPTAFKTQIAVRCDGRNLQNFLKLRTDNHSHYEIRNLAKAIYDVLPEEHKYLFKDYVNEA